MIICIPTVEHSGTHFILNLFKSHGFAHKRPNEVQELNGNTVIQDHFGHKHWSRFEELRETYQCPVVIPLRRLHSIFLSWERRQKDFSDLDNRLSMLTEYKHGHLWLPIDAEYRDSYLNHLNQALNLNLVTDWAIQGSEKHTAYKLESEIQDQETYSRLKKKHSRFFSRFYRS